MDRDRLLKDRLLHICINHLRRPTKLPPYGAEAVWKSMEMSNSAEGQYWVDLIDSLNDLNAIAGFLKSVAVDKTLSPDFIERTVQAMQEQVSLSLHVTLLFILY